jgi:hypothetical protein
MHIIEKTQKCNNNMRKFNISMWVLLNQTKEGGGGGISESSN